MLLRLPLCIFVLCLTVLGQYALAKDQAAALRLQALEAEIASDY